MLGKQKDMDKILAYKKELLENIKLDSERWYNLAKEHNNNWVKNKKCKCCNDPLIKSGKDVLNCKHWKKSIDSCTKELRESWNNKIGKLCKINLGLGLNKLKEGSQYDYNENN